METNLQNRFLDLLKENHWQGYLDRESALAVVNAFRYEKEAIEKMIGVQLIALEDPSKEKRLYDLVKFTPVKFL